jgi:hypothetical protein
MIDDKLKEGGKFKTWELRNFGVERVLSCLINKGFEIVKVWKPGEFPAQIKASYEDIQFLILVENYDNNHIDWGSLEPAYEKLESENFKEVEKLCRKTDTIPLLIKVAFRPIDEERFKENLFYKNDRYFCKLFIKPPSLFRRIMVKGLMELF